MGTGWVSGNGMACKRSVMGTVGCGTRDSNTALKLKISENLAHLSVRATGKLPGVCILQLILLDILIVHTDRVWCGISTLE